MAIIKTNMFNRQEECEKTQPGEDLEQVAEEFIVEYGGKSLGELDTPSFMRKVCNVNLNIQRPGTGS